MEERGFVTQRVAELLRLKGFDGNTNHYYADGEDGLLRSLSTINWNDAVGYYSAPTVQAAIDWVETKGYWVVYRPLNYFSGVNASVLSYDNEDEWYIVSNVTMPTKYEALNKALEYCLENLIR
jgi:hypothetical protein